MKVRFGIGAISPGSGYEVTGADFADYAREAEERGVDSVWLADVLSAPHTVDPLIGMGYLAAVTRELKVGAGVIVLPGRNPMLVAAQLATLSALAPKRILPAFGIRAAQPPDRAAYPVAGKRAAVFDEAVEVVRALLTQESVTFHGEHFTFDDVSVAPRPTRPLDLWLGGRAPAALQRAGRLADGWLGSFVTPDEAAGARQQIADAATQAGRAIDEDHYGTYLLVADPATSPDDALTRIARQRPDLTDPRELLCHGWPEAVERAKQYVDGGITKFVVSPASPVRSRTEFLDAFGDHLVPLQN